MQDHDRPAADTNQAVVRVNQSHADLPLARIDPEHVVLTVDQITAIHDAARADLLAQQALERKARQARSILGRFAAFGRFAFSQHVRIPRHADTWRDRGPHESDGAMARRRRQVERKLATSGPTGYVDQAEQPIPVGATATIAGVADG